MLENHGQPWTKAHIYALGSTKQILDKQLKCASMYHKDVFKEWLRNTSIALGRKEEAVMAKMVSLGLLIPRLTKTNYHKENTVSDIFKKYSGQEAWEVLFENLQKDEKPDYNIHLLSGEYIAPKVFRNGGTLFMKCDTHDNLKDEFINLGKQVRLAVEALNKRKTQIKDEIQSIKALQNTMSEHSIKYPNSSVESFGLQYSKLFARRSELERILNNI